MTTRHAGRSGGRSRVLIILVSTVFALLAAGPPAALAAGWGIQTQGEDTWIEQVKATSASEAWVIRDDAPKVMYTNDGGASWMNADNTGLADDFEAIGFSGTQVGCICNRLGMVAYTTDAGATWGQIQTTCQPDEISYATASDVWMGGMNPRGKILHSTDGGATWAPQTYDATLQESLSAVQAVSATTCWAATSNKVMLSTDGGATWPATAITVPSGGYIGCMAATDASHAWVAGGATGSRFIMATSNGGTTWTTQFTGASGSDFNGIDMLPDNLHGWAASGDGVIFATTDGGTTWQAQVSGVTTILLDVDFVDATHGWATGTSGVTLHSGDGGGPADTTPPVTTPSLTSGCWVCNTFTNVGFTATDAGGVGAWHVNYKIGAAAWAWGWPNSCTAVIAAASDGPQSIRYYATDKAGNAETQRTFILNVDTKAPTPTGLQAASVRHNRTVALKFKIADVAPNAGRGSARIRVMTLKNKVLKTLWANGKPVNVALSVKYKAAIKAGKYKYVVNVMDKAGNLGSKVASARLTVK